MWTEDGWLRLAAGGSTPSDEVPAPELAREEFPPSPEREEFDGGALPVDFQTLRVPFDASMGSLAARPGWLRLIGRESLLSRHRQSLVARRVQAWRCRAATCVEFSPTTFQQMAGLTAFYDVTTHYYLGVTWDEALGRCVKLVAMDREVYSEPAGPGVAVPPEGPVFLEARIAERELRFSYSLDGSEWTPVEPVLDASRLSDDYCNGFTGAFLGLCVQDLSGQQLHADFDWFDYREDPKNRAEEKLENS